MATGKKSRTARAGRTPVCLDVAVCVGKDCRRDDGFRELRRELRDHPLATEVPCVGACEGPVAVVDPLGTPIVLERLRTTKRRRDVVELVTGRGDMTPRLRERRVTSKRATKIVARTRRRLRAA